MTTLTDRYVTATLSRLPEAKRADIERELRASIADAVDGRLATGEDEQAAEYAVLRDLGEPARLAAGYADRPQYLISPEYYLDYTRLLTVLVATVLPAVAGAMTLAQILKDAPVGTIIGSAISTTITTAMHLFFWVTLAFVAVERAGIQNPLRSQEWTPDQLPDGSPTRRARFGELLGVTVVSALFIVALLVSPRLSPVRDANGAPIGPLDPWLWDTGVIYLFTGLIVVGLIARYLRFYRPWRMSRAILILLVDIAGGVVLIWVGVHDHLLNPAFADALGWNQDAVEWTNRGITIAGAVVIVTAIVEAVTDYRRRGLGTPGV